MKNDALFSLCGVMFAYEDAEVLNVPELDIPAGEILALVGPNGSGKTTLLKILNDLLKPSSGTVLFEGRPAPGDPDLRAKSVYVHQSPFPLAGTVYRNVSYGLRVRRVPEPEIRRRVGEALAFLGLESFGRRNAKRLSGGETQRVALARALALGPEILLLDEPTAQTDRASAEKIRRVLADLADRGGVTIILSTHDPALAEALADRAAFLDEGRLTRIETVRHGRAGTFKNPSLETAP